ncbi:MAG: pyruvate, water dikinase regulatory protein [bacterium]
MSNGYTYYIYAVSDATGEMAMNVAFAAMRQFKVENVNILRRAKITDTARIRQIIAEAKKNHGILMHTLVSHELRKTFHEEAEKEGVVAIDIMGPVMDVLSTYFHATPSDEPGLKYRVTKDYFKRQEAIEFTVKHDDGLGLDTLDTADIVLLGISRTSKTPLSIYLAYRGYKVANVPLIRDVTLSDEVRKVDRSKLVGLVVSSQKLVQFRESRLMKLGRPLSEEYANINRVNEELEYCRSVYEDLGNIPVIDVTDKAIEEIATEVLMVLGK